MIAGLAGRRLEHRLVVELCLQVVAPGGVEGALRQADAARWEAGEFRSQPGRLPNPLAVSDRRGAQTDPELRLSLYL